MRATTGTTVRIRPSTTTRRRTTSRSGLGVFTAVDGTLLDLRSFAAGLNSLLVRRLQAAGVPVVPVTVMTLDEIEPVASELGLQQAMIIEAGGAIARWIDGAWVVEPCGPPAETLLDVVRDIEDRTGANLLIFSALEDPAASQISGRSGEMLQRAKRRRFSEPFVIEHGSIDAVREAAASIGFSVRRGRRFFHLCRACDEGEAFTRLRDEFRCDVAIALGGSPVDAEFLGRADVPIIMPGPDGRADAELMAQVPNAQIARAPAPEGWAAAINEVWPSLAGRTRKATRA